MGHQYPALLLLLAGTCAVAQSAAPAQPAQRGQPPKHVCTDLGKTEIVPCPGEHTPDTSGESATAQVPKNVAAEQSVPVSPNAPSPKENPEHADAKSAGKAISESTQKTDAARDGEAARLRAEAPPDANLSALPPASGFPQVGLRDLPLNLLQDQRNFFTSPLRARTNDLNLILPFAGITTFLAAGGDRGIESHLPASQSLISRSKSISNYGAAAMAGGVAGAWLLGEARHDDHMTEAGFLSGEGAISTLAIAELAKYSFGRQRPQAGDGKGSFFNGGDSFPSLHAAAAFSIATVMSEEYPSPFVKFLSYGAASGIAAARVTGREHFASDALVGAGLGWFMGRQVYRAHHDNDGDLKRWGTFERAAGDRPKSSSLGSPYVPLDSWVYPAFDRLIAAGYVQSGFLGLRPWTRTECARLVDEAQQRSESSSVHGLDSYLRALAEEFSPELRGDTRRSAVESIYVRYSSISDQPLTDGYHFGQTIVNDFGRPYREGNNAITGASGYASFGPVTFYLRGEFQHSSSAPPLPLNTRETIAAIDLGLPVQPALPQTQVDRVRLIEAYAAVNLDNWQISFGSQALWWGPGESGPMLFSDNAQPLPMLRISRVKPIKFDGIFSLLGEVRAESFLGRLQGQQLLVGASGLVGQYGTALSDQPFISGQKISFKFTPNSEFSVSRTVLLGGTGVPFTSHAFLKGLFGVSNGIPGTTADEGDERSGLDFVYRIPKLRNWLTFYADGFTDDEFSPIAYWDRAAWSAGLYLSHLPGLAKIDLRAEGVYTDLPIGGAVAHGFFYYNNRFKNGYTNSGDLIGSWIGRQGQGAQAWSTYRFSARSYLQLGFRHQKTSAQFLPGGGTLTDFTLRSEFRPTSSLTVGASLQYEQWVYPILSAAVQRPLVTSLQLTYWPKRLSK